MKLGENLRTGNTWLILLWRLGRWGQRLGIIGVLLAPALIVGRGLWRAYRSGAPVGWGSLLGSAAAVGLGCAGVVVCSVTLKSYARKRGDPTGLFRQQ